MTIQRVASYNDLQPFPIMHTEEDTFKALKRHPFQEVREAVRLCRMAGISQRTIIGIVKRAGWEPRDYMNQLAKEVNKQALSPQ